MMSADDAKEVVVWAEKGAEHICPATHLDDTRTTKVLLIMGFLLVAHALGNLSVPALKKLAGVEDKPKPTE